MAGQEGRCLSCRAEAPAYDGARSCVHYRGTARALVHLLKYEQVRTAAPWIAAALAAVPLPDVDVIVPVPLGPGRRRRRGFNQSEAIARALARRRRLRLAPAAALARRRETAPQSGLDAEARRRNVEGAFRARGKEVAGRRILLVDDVLTTGATAGACATALKRAGAAAVHVLTYARADLRWVAAATPGGGEEGA